MAKYYKKANIRYLSEVKTGIESFSTKITVEEDDTSMDINVWDRIKITYTNKSTSTAPFLMYLDDVQVGSGNTRYYYGTVSLEIIEGDDILFFKLGPEQQLIDNTIFIVELKNGDNTYLSYNTVAAQLGFNYYNIENIRFTDIIGTFDSAIKSPMFSFEARTGYLDFISHSSFVSGSTKVFTSADIYDCTTVNFGDTLSLKDGANFLAIGAHSMVRLDDEED